MGEGLLQVREWGREGLGEVTVGKVKSHLPQLKLHCPKMRVMKAQNETKLINQKLAMPLSPKCVRKNVSTGCPLLKDNNRGILTGDFS